MIFKYMIVIVYLLENIKYGMLKSDRSSAKNQNNCKDDNNQHFKYSQENNFYLVKIHSALESYEPCITTNCSCHGSVIEQDLSPFKEGISKKMIDDVQTRGTKYQIVNHKLFRQKECMFPSRCKGVEHFILPWLNTLPDMELIINVRDWPQVNRQWGIQGPVFSFSKTLDNMDIMYPAWGFWEGGPAISLYPTGLGRWDMHRISLMKASKIYPWSAKEPAGFFRGSRTSSERDRLVLLSRSKPNLVDAQFTKNQAWKSPNDTLNMEPALEMSLEDHCKYKYLFNFRGVAASFRFKHLFLCKSLVFHVGSDWIEFFYPSLKPWVHYVPVSENATQEDLENILTFFVEHDDIAEGIASRGYEHIRDNLTMKDVHCYWKKLLKKYAKLLKFKIIKDDDLIEIRSTS